jgi:hypothetical protein
MISRIAESKPPGVSNSIKIASAAASSAAAIPSTKYSVATGVMAPS